MTATTHGSSLPQQRAVAPSSPARTGERQATRLIGALFIAGFVTYGVGFALAGSVTGAVDPVAAAATHRTLLVLGAVLMLLNTVVDIGKGVLFFPILARYGRRTALTYLSALIFEVTLLAVGVLCLLSLGPLADHVGTGGLDPGTARSLGSVAVQTSTIAYQIGQAALAFGAFFLCVLLYRTRLVPRLLAAWGVVGYAVHFTGAVAELFGSHTSMYFLVPGGLFELAFGVWLIVKGVRSVQPPAPAVVTVEALV